MSQSISISADLSIFSETHQITVLSNEKEIGIAVTGESIPKLPIASIEAFRLLKRLPEVQLDQLVTIVFNQKEIYRSDKSLFHQSGTFLLIRIFLKNLF